MEPQYSHILVLHEASGLRTFKLIRPYYTIGRSLKANIYIEGEACSRHHATLVRVEYGKGARYQLVDGNPRKARLSANGTYVNENRRVTAHILKHKDRILFGCQQVTATYLRVPRTRVSDRDLHTIAVEESISSAKADSVVAVAPNGEAILWRDRDTN